MKAKEKEVRVKTEKTFLYKNNRVLRKNTKPLVYEKDVGDLKKYGLISEIKSREVYSKKVVEPKVVYAVKNIGAVLHKEISTEIEDIKVMDGFFVIPDGRKYRSKKQAEKALDKIKSKVDVI